MPFFIAFLAGLSLLLSAAPLQAKDVLNPSGYPIPRFVSIKVNEANVRNGPGTRYPIRWVYKREGWPVEIIEEFGQWRRIRDVDGETGWIHMSMLAGERHAILQEQDVSTLLEEPDPEASPVLKAAKGVVATVGQCAGEWCLLEIESHTGWVKKSQLWGVYENETFQ